MTRERSKIWLRRVIGGVLILLLLIQLFISLVLAPLVENQLTSLVHERSQGLYQLEHVKLDWAFFNRKIWFSDLQVGIDSTATEVLAAAVKEGKSLFRIEIPQVELEWLDLPVLFKKGVLHLRSVEIFSPKVSMNTHRQKTESLQKEQSTDSLIVKNWLELLQPYLNGISINRLRISGGAFRLNVGEDVSQNSFVAQDIDVLIQEFQLDSTTSPRADRPFFAKEISIEVGVNNYSYVLPDSSYNIRMGRLGVSTSGRTVFAEDVEMQPNFRRYRRQVQTGKAAGNLLELHIPRIELAGLQINEIFFDRLLHLDKIQFDSPYLVEIGSRNRQASSENVAFMSIDNQALYDRFAPFLHSIRAKQIQVNRGHFQRLAQPGDTLRTMDLTGIGMILNNVRLDSMMLIPDRRILYSDSLAISVEKFGMRISEDAYLLRGDSLVLSSQAQSLIARQLYLMPRQTLLQEARSQGQDVIELYVPRIDIQGLDLAEVLYDRQVDLKAFRVQQPQTKLLNFPDVRKEQVDSLAQADLYHLVSDYLESVNVEEFEVIDGYFSLNTQPEPLDFEFSASDIHILIRNFQLNDSAKLRTNNPFYADDINVNVDISGYSFQLPDSSYTVQANHIGVSAADSSIFADSVWLIPIDRKEVADNLSNEHALKVFVPHIRLAGLDIYQAYFDRVLDLDSLRLDHPLIYVNSNIQQRNEMVFTELDSIDLYPLIQGQLQAVHVKRLAIDSAAFSYERIRQDTLIPLNLPLISLGIQNFFLDSTTHIGPDNLLYSDDIQLTLEDFTIPLADSVHEIEVGSLALSTRKKEIQIQDISLSPKETEHLLEELKSPNLYQITVPDLEIEGVNAYELYKEQRLLVDRILLKYPRISLTNYPEVNKEQIDSLARTDLYSLISRQLNELEVGSFGIIDGTFDLNETRSDSRNAFSAKDILVSISGFRLDSTAQMRTNNPFYADKLRLSMDVNNYSFQLPDSSYEIQVDNIAFSTADSSISAKNIRLFPRLAGTDQRPVALSFEISAPDLVVRGINPEELYFNRLGNFSGILIDQPTIVATHHGTTKRRRPFDLYKKIIPHVDRLAVGDIQVNHASLRQIYPPDDSSMQIDIPDFSVFLRGFLLDSLGWMQENRVLYANDSKLKIHGYEMPLQDSLFTISAKEIGFSSGSQAVYVDSLQLASNFHSEDLYEKLGYVKDELSIQVPHLQGIGMNLYHLMEDDRIDLQSLRLTEMNILIKKDRNFPVNPDKRPPLLQDLLSSLPLTLSIESLGLEGGQLDFYEHPVETDRQGYFYMDRLQAEMSGLSNDSSYLNSGKKPQLILHASTNLMGVSPCAATFTYWLADSSRRYTIAGSVGEMPMDVLNDILQPSAAITISDGRLDSLRFDLQGNRRRSRGRMMMGYHDLKIAVINAPNEEEELLRKKRLPTAIANGVVKSRNPKRWFRVGRIRYEVDRSKIFFAHWIQAVLSGVKSSIGLENKEEKTRLFSKPKRRKRAKKGK